MEEYDALYKKFNPTRFNAAEWANIARDAGMKYLVFDTRHHDGFAMFYSKVDDYNVGSTPFKRDVSAELAVAFRQAGLKLGWYFSPPNWHDPDYNKPTSAKYVARTMAQLREILTNYGKVDVMWFDGSIASPSAALEMVRSLQPGILVNNRLIENGADFLTPEQNISPYQDLGRPEQVPVPYYDQEPWETCMNLCGAVWSWAPNDPPKPARNVIRILATCAGGDGNLLLNVGPRPDGSIEPDQVAVLKSVGAWLRRNGESIYGTRGGPYKPDFSLACTRKGNSIYLHLFNPPAWLALPALPKKIKSAATLAGEKIAVSQTAEAVSLQIPAQAVNDVNVVVKMELDGSAMDIPAMDASKPLSRLPEGTRITASSVDETSPTLFAAEKAFDRDFKTSWRASQKVTQATMTIEYPQSKTVSSFSMMQAHDWLRSVELQYQDGAKWKTIFKDAPFWVGFKRDFAPVTAKTFRMNATECACGGPVFREVGLE